MPEQVDSDTGSQEPENVNSVGEEGLDEAGGEGGLEVEAGTTADAEVVGIENGTVGDFINDPSTWDGELSQEAYNIHWESPWAEDEDGNPIVRESFLTVTRGENGNITDACNMGQVVETQGPVKKGETVKIIAKGDGPYERIFK